jgi:Fe-S-cluster containining protein
MMEEKSNQINFFPRIYEKLRALNPSISKAKLKDVMLSTLLSLRDEDLSPLKSIQNQYCHRCGNCCITSKYIGYRPEEISQISIHLGLSIPDLIKKYEVIEDASIYLITGTPCPFLKGKNECRIYQVRPQVCRDFPMGYSISRLGKREPPFPSFCPAIDDLIVKLITMRIHACKSNE